MSDANTCQTKLPDSTARLASEPHVRLGETLYQVRERYRTIPRHHQLEREPGPRRNQKHVELALVYSCSIAADSNVIPTDSGP